MIFRLKLAKPKNQINVQYICAHSCTCTNVHSTHIGIFKKLEKNTRHEMNRKSEYNKNNFHLQDLNHVPKNETSRSK